MTEIGLTKGQQKALSELRDACATDYRDCPKVIIVQGFSGAGKSALVGSVEDELIRQGHLVLHQRELQFADSAVNHMDHKGQVVVTAGFYIVRAIKESLNAIENPVSHGFYDVDWSQITKRKVHYIDLKGMDVEEMRAYATARQSQSLGLDEIVECSVGLPGLANELIDIPNLSLMVGRRLAALHLWKNINDILSEVPESERYFKRFLGVQPTSEIKEIFDLGFDHPHSFRQRHIYDCLPQLRSNQCKDQVPEEVTFIAAESLDLYTQSLGKLFVEIDLIMPGLSAEEFEAIAKLMGYTNEDYSFGGITPRWRLFGVNQKELCSYGHIGEKEFGMKEWKPLKDYSFREWRVRATAYQQAVETGMIPFPDRSGEGIFMVTVNDHGGVNNQPLNFGWMLESFLQQRGIAYIAHSTMCDKSYVFNPAERKLDFLGEDSSRKINKLESELRTKILY